MCEREYFKGAQAISDALASVGGMIGTHAGLWASPAHQLYNSDKIALWTGRVQNGWPYTFGYKS